MPVEGAAGALTAILAQHDEVYRTGFIARGMICREVRDRRLWQHVLDPKTRMPYESMDRWIAGTAPWSRRSCYAAMAAVDELSRDIPVETLAKIPQCNLAPLQRMSTQARQQPEVLAAARTLSEHDFAVKVEQDYPEQHLESRQAVRFLLSASQRRVLEQAIAHAMSEGCASREEALVDAICANYLADVLPAER